MSDREPPTTSRLRRLAKGTWLPLDAVRSVIAFAGDEKLKVKPYVTVKTDAETISWSFEDIEHAVEFADRIGEMCNGE